MINRREFLKNTVKGIAGLAVPLAAIEIINPGKILAAKSSEKSKVRWVFLVDTYKCVGCGLCVKACKNENEIPYDANVTRTWVERYVLTKEGRLFADSPKGARDGFITTKIDLGLGNFQDIKKRILRKHSLSPNSATSARIRLAYRYVRWAQPIKPLTGLSSWTGPGASAAGIASWHVLTESDFSTRNIIRLRNAISATTG